jgi:hypothetical protein
MARKQTVTVTKIRKVLARCKFDPKKGGPLAIIIEQHIDDPRYLESRAIEMIREAQLAIRQEMTGPDNPMTGFDVYQSKMDNAILLLAIAEVVNDQFRK